jgi:hypothetical protein
MKSIVGLHSTGTAAAGAAAGAAASGTGGYSFVGEDGEDELSTEVSTYTKHYLIMIMSLRTGQIIAFV